MESKVCAWDHWRSCCCSLSNCGCKYLPISFGGHISASSIGLCPCKKGNFGDRHAYHGNMKKGVRMVCLSSRGMSKIAIKPSEAKQEARSKFFLIADRRNEPCRHFDLGLPSLQNWETIHFCCLSHPFCG